MTARSVPGQPPLAVSEPVAAWRASSTRSLTGTDGGAPVGRRLPYRPQHRPYLQRVPSLSVDEGVRRKEPLLGDVVECHASAIPWRRVREPNDVCLRAGGPVIHDAEVRTAVVGPLAHET